MTTKRLLITVAGVLLIGFAGRAYGSYPDTRTYLIGDVDGFVYNGVGSADDVYADPSFRAWYDHEVAIDPGSEYANGVQGFDILANDHATLFTFVFPLSAGETVVGATLSVAMRATGGQVYNDRIDLESDRGPWDTSYRYDFSDLNWLPITTSGTDIRTLDLANSFGCYAHPAVANNLLPLLQDGRFNVMVHDDEAIDYAQLTVQVTPEPATLSALLVLGGLAILKRRTKKV